MRRGRRRFRWLDFLHRFGFLVFLFRLLRRVSAGAQEGVDLGRVTESGRPHQGSLPALVDGVDLGAGRDGIDEPEGLRNASPPEVESTSVGLWTTGQESVWASLVPVRWQGQ